MAEEEDRRWLQATANELNNLLQIICEAQENLTTLQPAEPTAEKLRHIISASIKRAMEVGRVLAERAAQGADGHSLPTVLLPELPTSRVTEITPPPEVEIYNPRGARELILIVDDEEFILLLAQQVLADAGYRVITARQGFQALEIFRQMRQHISLVILDLMMPGMDGETVLAELQLIDPQVSVVLSSGFAEQERLRKMMARGLRGFLPKPYTHQKLLAQIRLTLDTIASQRTPLEA